MKKRMGLAVLAVVCLAGVGMGQTFEKPKHLKSVDRVREQVFSENENSNKLFRSFIMEESRASVKTFSITGITDATNAVIDAYKAWLWEKIVCKSIKLGGKIDFGGQNGTTYSVNPEFISELPLPLLGTFPLVLNAGIKRDEKITSFEFTVGSKYEVAINLAPFYIYGKASFGSKFPGGNTPTSLIGFIGPGLGFKLDKDWKYNIEVDLLFYGATNPVFSDGDIMRKHDMVINIGILYTFASPPKF